MGDDEELPRCLPHACSEKTLPRGVEVERRLVQDDQPVIGVGDRLGEHQRLPDPGARQADRKLPGVLSRALADHDGDGELRVGLRRRLFRNGTVGKRGLRRPAARHDRLEADVQPAPGGEGLEHAANPLEALPLATVAVFQVEQPKRKIGWFPGNVRPAELVERVAADRQRTAFHVRSPQLLSDHHNTTANDQPQHRSEGERPVGQFPRRSQSHNLAEASVRLEVAVEVPAATLHQ